MGTPSDSERVWLRPAHKASPLRWAILYHRNGPRISPSDKGLTVAGASKTNVGTAALGCPAAQVYRAAAVYKLRSSVRFCYREGKIKPTAKATAGPHSDLEA